MSNSEQDTATSTKWTAIIEYITGETIHVITHQINGIEELQNIVEGLHDWNSIKGWIRIDLRYNFKKGN